MFSLFTSIALVVVGVWIIRLTRGRNPSQRTSIQHIQNLERVNQLLLRSTNDLKEHRAQLLNKVTLLENNRLLDVAVAEDAIKREERAKGALLGVLKQNGCDAEQIAKVMALVDGKDEGDL